MKILVISSTCWSNNNSFGNTFNSIFDGFNDEIEIYNIYCSNEAPESKIVKEYFQIAPKNLLKKLFGKKCKIGNRFSNAIEGKIFKKTKKEIEIFNFARKHRYQILFWARDILWKIVNWKTNDLKDFLESINVDLIFTPIYYSSYLNDILQYVADFIKVPVLGYISDDCYTLKLLNFSPLFWIDRLWKRYKVKKSIELCRILYVISEIQKNEYEKIFHKECKILTKSKMFDQDPPKWILKSNRYSLIYAGNIGDERWKSLALISNAIQKLNQEDIHCCMQIYTTTPINRLMRKSLELPGTTLNCGVTYKRIMEIQRNADILVHVEGMSLKARLLVHQSFSTKLVDMFELGKCIFVVGPDDVASISHLKNNDAGIIATSKNETYEKLRWLLLNPNKIMEYGQKAYECGKKHHNYNDMHYMLESDIYRYVKK